MDKVIICYIRYESFYEDSDTEIKEWITYTSLEDFEKDYPDCKAIYVFYKGRNLLR